MKRPSIHIGNTEIRGIYEPAGIAAFRNIPFARAERWKKAKRLELDMGVLDASQNGPAPVQGPPAPFFAQFSGELKQVPYDEDCLNINIWTGDVERKKKKVLVWIYGGAYIAGYNYRKGFTPEEFVRRHPEIIVAAPNYRVGVLGNLNLAALSADEEYKYSNNLSLLDIIEALGWVKENIASFGGDPDEISIYGHSAGSNAISHLLTMPLAKGLFKRAVCQSSFMTDTGTVTYESSLDAARAFFGFAKVNNLQQALELTPEEILAAQKQLFRVSFGGKAFKLFSPVADGLTVHEDGFLKFLTGSINCEAMMIGGSEGEQDQMFRGKSAEETLEMVIARNRSKHVTEEDAKSYAELFPERSLKESYMSINNSLGIALGGEFIARAAANHIPVYEYQFLLRRDDGENRALHGDPTFYAFGSLADPTVPAAFTNKVMDCFAAFIDRGDPNCASIPVWPKVSQDYSVMCMDETWKAVPQFFSRDMDFWGERFEESAKQLCVNSTLD